MLSKNIRSCTLLCITFLELHSPRLDSLFFFHCSFSSSHSANSNLAGKVLFQQALSKYSGHGPLTLRMRCCVQTAVLPQGSLMISMCIPSSQDVFHCTAMHLCLSCISGACSSQRQVLHSQRNLSEENGHSLLAEGRKTNLLPFTLK